MTASAAITTATFAEAFQATVAERADEVALRTADGSTEITFGEYAERVRGIAGGLARLGVQRGDTVALLTINRPEFHLYDAAAMHLGAAAFSVYATSSPEQIAYLFDNAGNDVLITERAFQPVVDALAEKPKHVIWIEDGIDEDPDFDLEAAWRAIQPDDLLTLIYTSGTTGPPKGVELTHENMLAQWRGLSQVLPIRRGGRVISYLPMAHIADRSGTHYAQMLFGFEITSVADPRQVAAVLPQVRPAMWGAVPRVAEKLKAAIEAGIAAEPDAARKAALEDAINAGIERVRLEVGGEPIPNELFERLTVAEEHVLKPLRAKLGLDDVDWVMFGAAPIPMEVHEFIRGLGIPTTEVYGMSESACVATTYAPEEARLGTVGRAIPGIELAIADDGEVLMRGASIMRGYRGDPEKTAETIDADGWLHSGDIGELEGDGCVRIVDRKKELIINAAGKNMSPANIEAQLKSAHPLIGQAAVIGDNRPYNVALLVIDPDMAPAFEGQDVDQLIFEAISDANAKLSRVEQIKRWRVLADEWLPGGDELTPTMKLKRKPIAEKYAAEIEALYA